MYLSIFLSIHLTTYTLGLKFLFYFYVSIITMTNRYKGLMEIPWFKTIARVIFIFDISENFYCYLRI